jgi:hypothetical protein
MVGAEATPATAVRLVNEPLTKIVLPGSETEAAAAAPLDYEMISQRARLAAVYTDPLLIQVVATLAAVGAIFICYTLVALLRANRLKSFLRGLPSASTDGQWLVVAYEWGDARVQSGRMPLDRIVSSPESPESGAVQLPPERRPQHCRD